MTVKLPLSEMIVDFFDKLKTVSSGYAKLVYLLIETLFVFCYVLLVDCLVVGVTVILGFLIQMVQQNVYHMYCLK